MNPNLFKSLFLFAFLFLVTSCSKQDGEVTSSDEQQQFLASYNHTADEIQMVELINDYRVAHGYNALEIVNHISYKSQEHNSYMINNNVVNHDLFLERSNNIIQVLGAIRVGENIAYNFVTSQGALSAWLLSPSHKLNLDGDYSHIGISITINPANGKKYYTNMFMKK